MLFFCLIALALAGCGDAFFFPTGCCPPGYTKIGIECFQLSTFRVTWNLANTICQWVGGELAVPSDVSALNAYVLSQSSVSTGVWIGGTDQSNEGDWENYINGEPIKSTDWSEDQPDNFGGAEDCLELRRTFSPPLNDYRCYRWQNYICEVPCTLKCPSPSVQFGDECFHIVTDEKKNWNDARQHCIDMGGDLAVPSYPIDFDNYVFDEAAGPGVWIGGTDQESEGEWTNYINGEVIQSGVWSENQPDNLGNEDCLEIRSYFDPPLNDYLCNMEQEFVCEFTPL